MNLYNKNDLAQLAAQTDIDVSNLPQGMYLLRALTTNGQNHQAKFIRE